MKDKPLMNLTTQQRQGLTKAHVKILACLAEGPKTAQEIAWEAGIGSHHTIHYSLGVPREGRLLEPKFSRSLLAYGMVSSDLRPSRDGRDAPERVYKLTEAGRQRLREIVSDQPS